MNTHYIGSYFLKIWDTVEHPKLWLILTSIALFFNQYVFSQWIFAFGFFMLFLLDTFSGVYIAHRTHRYSGKLFRDMLMDKSVAYFTIILAFSVATKVTLKGSETNLIQYLNLPVYSLFIIVELRSIVVNWYRFKQWPWLGTLLKFIDKTKKETIDEIIQSDEQPNSHP